MSADIVCLRNRFRLCKNDSVANLQFGLNFLQAKTRDSDANVINQRLVSISFFDMSLLSHTGNILL
ncbi:hypothetical protein A9Q96_09745 [Rhodobacterales bacterium 52_120_T64]|nr:hypothetical protein A9Q96_09745 [Rhodobacterales bacterium 52_120_T64]